MRVDSEFITTEKRLLEVLKEVHKYELFLDTESTGLKYASLLLGLSFYSNHFKKAYWVATNYYFKQGLSVETISKCFNKFKYEVTFHNAKYDYTVLERNSIDTKKFKLVDDTIILIHIQDPELEKNMEKRLRADFGVKKKTFKEVVGKNWDKIDWVNDQIMFEGDTGCFTYDQLASYACEDVYWTYRLREYYLPKVQADSALYKVYTDIELPLVPVLVEMYMRGVNIEEEVLTRMDGVLIDEIERTKEVIFKKCGLVFNMNSPQQKADVLYNKLGYPVLAYTKTGNPSTDAPTLDKLADMDYEVCVDMREYSVLQKLYSGYVNGIPNMLDYDGRLRGNFNSTGTKTGRFSSDKPNLQNQPNNKAYPVRRAFIPTKGYKMIVADYSQIELRFMAHVSQDKIFMEAFWRGDDIHQQVADDLGITRKQAKIVNFAVLYGMTYMGLSLSLKVKEKVAKLIIANYEATYKGFYKWKTRVEDRVKKEQLSRTIFGRVRRMPYVNNPKMHNAALRQGVNAEVQGGSADVIKLAMIKIHKKWVEENDYGARMLMQVHDELICEAPAEFAERAYTELLYAMENVVKLSVPLLVEGVICDSWDAMKGGDIPDYLETLNAVELEETLTYLYMN